MGLKLLAILHIYLGAVAAAPIVKTKVAFVGWQHHPVCQRSYHFIIPAPTAALQWPYQPAAKAIRRQQQKQAETGVYEQQTVLAPAVSKPVLRVSPRTAGTAKTPAGSLPAAGSVAEHVQAQQGPATDATEQIHKTDVAQQPAIHPEIAAPPTATSGLLATGSDAHEASAAGTLSGCVLESHSHLLHGVLHLNGFGHLLRVNGREGGSQQLSGAALWLR